MTVFDIVLVLIVLVSALVGYARGAIKEVVTLFAFTLAALAAVFSLPVTGRLFRGFVHPAWAGNAVAVLAVFVAAYVAIRVLAGALTKHVHASRIGALDRSAGAAFGVARALVLAGAFALVFGAVTPADSAPRWITGGFTWPVASASGHALGVFAPGGMKLADSVTRLMGADVKKGFSETDDGGGLEVGGAPANATATEATESSSTRTSTSHTHTERRSR